MQHHLSNTRSDHDARWSRLQEALEKHFGPLRLTAARPLGGGISAHTFAVDFEGTMRETATVVVKLPRLGPKRERQRAARYEYQVLALLRGTGIGAPQPLLLDVAGSIPVVRFGKFGASLGFGRDRDLELG